MRAPIYPEAGCLLPEQSLANAKLEVAILESRAQSSRQPRSS
jgi:hypothetical protein